MVTVGKLEVTNLVIVTSQTVVLAVIHVEQSDAKEILDRRQHLRLVNVLRRDLTELLGRLAPSKESTRGELVGGEFGEAGRSIVETTPLLFVGLNLGLLS